MRGLTGVSCDSISITAQSEGSSFKRAPEMHLTILDFAVRTCVFWATVNPPKHRHHSHHSHCSCSQWCNCATSLPGLGLSLQLAHEAAVNFSPLASGSFKFRIISNLEITDYQAVLKIGPQALQRPLSQKARHKVTVVTTCWVWSLRVEKTEKFVHGKLKLRNSQRLSYVVRHSDNFFSGGQVRNVSWRAEDVACGKGPA